MKKKKIKKNPSNRGGELKCNRHKGNRHTDRPSDEAGPRGAFAPKKH